MKKLIFIIGFLLPLPAYFNDKIAGYIQNLSGKLWPLFSSLGFLSYPIYLAMFFLPVFLILSIIWNKLQPKFTIKDIFLMFLYGFIASGAVFIFLALIAVSQFKFAQ